MSVLAWVGLGAAIGIFVGAASRLPLRGLAGSTVAGALGGVIGGFVATALVGLDAAGLNAASMLAAAVGALALAALFRSHPAADDLFA